MWGLYFPGTAPTPPKKKAKRGLRANGRYIVIALRWLVPDYHDDDYDERRITWDLRTKRRGAEGEKGKRVVSGPMVNQKNFLLFFPKHLAVHIVHHLLDQGICILYCLLLGVDMACTERAHGVGERGRRPGMIPLARLAILYLLGINEKATYQPPQVPGLNMMHFPNGLPSSDRRIVP